MSAEHQRYIYSNPQGGSTTSYEYQAYPAQAYVSAPPPQAPPRPIRSPITQFHSQHHQTTFAASSSYTQQASYAPAPSYTLPQSQPQWQPDSSWSPQFRTFQPTSITADVTYAPNAARPESVSQTTPAEARSYAAGPSNPPLENRRPDERYPPGSAHASPVQKSKRRDKESPVLAPSPIINPSLDFGKMVESYGMILEGTKTLASAGVPARLPPPETMERMIQSANYGRQMLQSAVAQSNDMRPSTGGSDKDTPAIKRQKAEEHAQEGQTCLGCNATSTPEWRRGPLG
ncbi:hypothetical protein CY34DRAFT_434324 [Suillus luteus UH-Slu-Lm8-n1]|uniref:GATA-type domain-containing protein n=1 Tax=Suillus luteus UH-Slu-Lm8-n1 TaxID=930992 RepID=A0A0D0BHK4_9AGAM|nr:hypothetical protein CY34DRAFT_434324 [Suillus luteus UH-Slu-Lm8-n1]